MDLLQIKNLLNKVIVFYNPDKAEYWNTITRCNINIKPQELGKYYLDFSSKSKFPGKFDNNQIPQYFYQNKLHYHPIVICQYALGLYEILLSSNFTDEEIKCKFLLQADWLVSNVQKRKGINCWTVDYNINMYGLKAPWISAMTQGEAISVLTRAYYITNNQSYLDLADNSIGLLEISVKEGGLVNKFYDLPVFEEYPLTEKTVAVLNGFIFCLFGLYDLWLTNRNQQANDLFWRGTRSLKNLLPYYDIGYWSQYHLFDFPSSFPATFTYHSIVFEQLKVLYLITEENIFFDYYSKWYLKSTSFLNKTRVLYRKLILNRKLD